VWKDVSWGEYSRRIDDFTRGLLSLGVKRGDKVGLIGSNTPEWFVSDMAIMTMGATTVPVYATNSAEQIAYILNHSESKIFIIEDISYYQRIEKILDKIPSLKYIIVLTGPVDAASGMLISLEKFLEKGRAVGDEQLKKVHEAVAPDDVAAFIYTSGTTGPPKAVMLTHRNSAVAAENVGRTIKMKAKETRCPTYLPLSHVAERTVNLYGNLYTGHVVCFIGGYAQFIENLPAVRPTLCGGVPRVWEKLYEGIMKYRSTLPENKRKMVDWALKTGDQCNQAKYNKRPISPLLSIKYSLARALVINKLLASLGLDKVEIVFTGGAPTSKEILDFYTSVGLWLQDVYGQTEGHGTTSWAMKDDVRFGSAGKPYPLTKVVLADDGEILVKGDHVSPGYYKDPELTKETFKDGWLYSGDLGRFDEDGFLWVTGRKKDIIITSGGKNITPSKIESMLLQLPFTEYAIVVGDGKKYLAALLLINEETIKSFAEKNGLGSKSFKEIVNSPELHKAIESHIEMMNAKLSRVEQIKKFKILDVKFSQDGGELTPTMKMKRFFIQKKYAREIDDLYKSDD
jgi:long-chain acyl-CoA synthetase